MGEDCEQRESAGKVWTAKRLSENESSDAGAKLPSADREQGQGLRLQLWQEVDLSQW